jgi:hypothetical protein
MSSRLKKAKGTGKKEKKAGANGRKTAKKAGLSGTPSDPRKRTLGRLKVLLAAGAAVGSMGAVESCGTVCDPLPPPLECAKNPSTSDMLFPRLNPHVATNAVWENDAGVMKAQVELLVEFYGYSKVVLEFGSDPQLVGAVLGTVTRQKDSLVFDCVPDNGVTEVEVTVAMNCDGLDEALHFKLDVSGTPVAGQRLAIIPLDD